MDLEKKWDEVSLQYAEMQTIIKAVMCTCGIPKDSLLIKDLQQVIGAYADAEIAYHVALTAEG